MQIEVFKTNVKSKKKAELVINLIKEIVPKKKAELVINLIKEIVPVGKINFDLEDRDKFFVLRQKKYR
jgi:hypothetical protein